VEDVEEKVKDLAGRVEELRAEWKRLWRERLDDRVRAEGIAKQDYCPLFVEKGTVIFATRDFKLLSFREILEEHGIGDAYRFVSPAPTVGGWAKFIRSSISRSRPKRGSRRILQRFVEEKKPQQLKKGGRGWLHA
jgi:hypothetical protein